MLINQTLYVVKNPFVSMKCVPRFIVIAIPEVTRTNFCWQDTHQMVKYKAVKASIRREGLSFNWNPYPTKNRWGSLQCPQTLRLHFLLNSLCSAGSVFGYYCSKSGPVLGLIPDMPLFWIVPEFWIHNERTIFLQTNHFNSIKFL